MKTRRDAILAVILPAVLTAMIYVWGFGRAASKRYADMSAQSQTSEENMPQSQTLEAARQFAESAGRQVALERERAAALNRELAAAGGVQPFAAQRPKALSRISKLLDEHRIGLVATSKLESAAAKDIEALTKIVPGTSAEFWRIEAVGSYGAMLGALQALRNASEFIVPVSIEMEAAGDGEDETDQKWTLTVWI